MQRQHQESLGQSPCFVTADGSEDSVRVSRDSRIQDRVGKLRIDARRE